MPSRGRSHDLVTPRRRLTAALSLILFLALAWRVSMAEAAGRAAIELSSHEVVTTPDWPLYALTGLMLTLGLITVRGVLLRRNDTDLRGWD